MLHRETGRKTEKYCFSLPSPLGSQGRWGGKEQTGARVRLGSRCSALNSVGLDLFVGCFKWSPQGITSVPLSCIKEWTKCDRVSQHSTPSPSHFPGKRWLWKEQMQKLAWPGLDKNNPGSYLRGSAGPVIESPRSEPWADLMPHPTPNLNAATSPVSWPFIFLWGILHLSPSCSGCTVVRALSPSFTCHLPLSQTCSIHPPPSCWDHSNCSAVPVQVQSLFPSFWTKKSLPAPVTTVTGGKGAGHNFWKT